MTTTASKGTRHQSLCLTTVISVEGCGNKGAQKATIVDLSKRDLNTHYMWSIFRKRALSERDFAFPAVMCFVGSSTRKTYLFSFPLPLIAVHIARTEGD